MNSLTIEVTDYKKGIEYKIGACSDDEDVEKLVDHQREKILETKQEHWLVKLAKNITSKKK